MVIICNGFFPTYSDTSIISLLGNGLNSLFITRKNNKVRNDINITFIIAEEPVDFKMELGKLRMIWVRVTIVTKKIASMLFNLSLFKIIFSFRLFMSPF